MSSMEPDPLRLLFLLWKDLWPAKLCEVPRLGNSPQNSPSVLHKFPPRYTHEPSGGTSQVSLLSLIGEKLRTRKCRDFSKDSLSLSLTKCKLSRENSNRKSSSVIFLSKWPSSTERHEAQLCPDPWERLGLEGQYLWAGEFNPAFSSQMGNSNLKRIWNSRQSFPK